MTGVNVLARIDDGESRRSELGTLAVTTAGSRRSLPLSAVRFHATAADRVAHVRMEQSFENPYTETLEAVYIFPLTGACAVSNFELRVAGRVIRAVVQERQAARESYRRATDEGRRAALLESERDDVFTVSVGNLPPGEAVAVTIEYAVCLPYHEGGTTELRLPLVVAPRYIPGRPIHGDPAGSGIEEDTDQVGDASRITPPRLVAGFDPRVSLAIGVDIVAGGVEEIGCSQHAVKTSFGDGGVRISLAREGELLDRDFVLRWRLAGREVTSTLLVSGECGMLSILPPVRDGFPGLPRDVIFILDRSGSMTGAKMASAARACSLLLATLAPRDRFNICAFDTVAEWLDTAWVAADEQSIERGNRYLRRISGRGGTELNPALDEALQKIDDGVAGRAAIIVILTDGQVGNEADVFRKVQTRLGNARIFTVGVDTAVNEAFLKRVAALGGGTASFVVPGESLEGALRSVGREIGAPLVTGLSVDGAERASIAPSTVADLFEGRATTVFLRLPAAEVSVRGTWADGSAFHAVVQARRVDLPAIPQLWARARVSDLEDQYRLQPARQQDVKDQIVKLAVAHCLLTRFTAFVACDEEIINRGGDLRQVTQPVHMPAEWEMPLDGFAAMRVGAMPAMESSPLAAMSFSRDMALPRDEALRGRIARSRGLGAPSGGAPASGRGISRDDRRKAVEALQRLSRTIDAARAALARGEVPSPSEIEAARATLLRLLTESGLGAVWIKLQRFLRSSALELVAALSSGAPVASIAALFDRHRSAFDEATKESGGDGGGKAGWRFWEKV